MKIDFVSDIACPWCAVGLHALEAAIQRARLAGDVRIEFQPFELNPAMPPEGEATLTYLARKYGYTPERIALAQAAIRERGAEVGFVFGERPWVWNTFDAHRLLHWAGLEGRQRRLKHVLLVAYHTRGLNVGDAGVLARLAGEAGLDPQRARQLLDTDEHAAEVKAREQRFASLGIRAVPSMVIDGRHLIQGAQPVEALQDALQKCASDAPAP